MKVLFVGYQTCCQNVSGGINVHIHSLMGALKNNGIDCKLFDCWKDSIREFDVIHFFKLQSDHYNLIQYARLEKKTIVISSIATEARKKWIEINVLLNKIGIHTVIGLNELMLKSASLILTQSHIESSFIHDAYNIEFTKIVNIPNGFPRNSSIVDETLIRKKIHIDSDFVLCVGRFDSNKNQLNLIRALNNSSIPLVLIGGPDPASESYYEKCISIANRNIHFVGWIPFDDPLLFSAYKAAKVVVLPSYHETFGNVILEGAVNNSNIAFNKRLPICQYGLDKYAYLFDVNDVNDIRLKIEQAFREPINPRLSSFVIENFSWDIIAKKTIEYYKSII